MARFALMTPTRIPPSPAQATSKSILYASAARSWGDRTLVLFRARAAGNATQGRRILRISHHLASAQLVPAGVLPRSAASSNAPPRAPASSARLSPLARSHPPGRAIANSPFIMLSFPRTAAQPRRVLPNLRAFACVGAHSDPRCVRPDIRGASGAARRFMSPAVDDDRTRPLSNTQTVLTCKSLKRTDPRPRCLNLRRPRCPGVLEYNGAHPRRRGATSHSVNCESRNRRRTPAHSVPIVPHSAVQAREKRRGGPGCRAGGFPRPGREVADGPAQSPQVPCVEVTGRLHSVQPTRVGVFQCCLNVEPYPAWSLSPITRLPRISLAGANLGDGALGAGELIISPASGCRPGPLSTAAGQIDPMFRGLSGKMHRQSKRDTIQVWSSQSIKSSLDRSPTASVMSGLGRTAKHA